MPASTNVANLVTLHSCAAEFGAKVVSVAVPRHKELLNEPKRHVMELSEFSFPCSSFPLSVNSLSAVACHCHSSASS